MHAKLSNGQVSKYPYTFADIRADYPNTSFPVPLDAAALVSLGMVEVRPTPMPEHDQYAEKAVEVTPVKTGDEWVQAWVVEPLTAAERKERLPRIITPRQARLALLGAGLLDTVEGAFAQLPEPQRTAASIEWEYATAIERHSPLVSQFGPMLGLTEAQIDALFIAGAAL